LSAIFLGNSSITKNSGGIIKLLSAIFFFGNSSITKNIGAIIKFLSAIFGSSH